MKITLPAHLKEDLVGQQQVLAFRAPHCSKNINVWKTIMAEWGARENQSRSLLKSGPTII